MYNCNIDWHRMEINNGRVIKISRETCGKCNTDPKLKIHKGRIENDNSDTNLKSQDERMAEIIPETIEVIVCHDMYM